MNSLKQNMEKFRENGYFIAEHIVSEKKINAVLENIFRIYFKYNPSSKLHELQEPWKSDLFHEEMIKFRKSDPRRFSLLYDSAQTGASLIELFSDELILKGILLFPEKSYPFGVIATFGNFFLKR